MDDAFESCVSEFVGSYDHYPTHYVIHLIHAVEILGYYHPTDGYRWYTLYLQMCGKLHMNPETLTQLEGRLNVNEEEFKKQQGL